MNYYTMKHVSETLGVSRPTVRRLIDRGELPAVRIGKTIKITKEAFDQYIDKIYAAGVSPSAYSK